MTAKTALRYLFARSSAPLLLLLLSLFSVHPFTASGQTAQTVPLTTAGVPLTGIIQPGDGNLYSVYQGDADYCYGRGTKCGQIEEVYIGSKTAFDPAYFTSPKNGGTLGNFPGNLLEGPEGYLFGTNGYGGSSAGTNGCSGNIEGCGTFFEFFFDSSIERGSHGYDSVNVLHNFSYAEGGQGGLITLGSDGNYYGVTVAAYRGFYGAPYTIYKLTPDGTFTELVNFANLNGQVDGIMPGQLVEGDDGYFYGTTLGPSSPGPWGTVFRMDTSGTLQTIATFPGDGSLGGYPVGQLVEGPDGAFYGVTGASASPATVFRVTKNGELTVLHAFTASEGMTPWGGLLLGSDGVLYGTMAAGGNTSICTIFGGCGTLFSINIDGSNFQVLHIFAGGSDGAHPNALIQDSIFSPGTIYGVTGNDGATSSPGGVIFQTILPAGHQAAPVQITMFKKSDMSPITSSSQIDPNTPLVLKWQVLDAFSNTMQQCYAHAYLPGDDNLQSGEDDWTGKQVGTADSTGYSGQATVTPQKSGADGYSLTCGGVESARFYVQVQGTLAITTAALPDGTVGQSYSQTLVASGGIAPYTWSVASGSLPPGLGLEGPNGILSGKPQQFGNYSFMIQAKDSSATPEIVTAQLTMTVNDGLAVNPTSLPQAVINKSYSQTISVTGGLPPYTETISAGSLPAGLTFSSANGAITGTPTKLGTFNFTFSVADSENPHGTATQAYILTVASSLLTIDSVALPAAGVGVAFSQQFVATGGVPPYTWTVASGVLPKGLLLSSTGTLSGTPQQYGPGNPFVVQVSDAGTSAQIANATFTLPVKNTLTITSTTLPTGTVGVKYSAPVMATGGIPPFSWTAGANLPTLGLSIDPKTGVISGIPQVAGTFTGGVGVTDSEGTPANTTVNIIIPINPSATAVSSTSLTTSNANAAVGESITFTAKVTVAGGAPTGIVTFLAGTQKLGTGTLNQSGVATLTTTFSTPGAYSVVASYAGDATDQASASSPLTETIVAPTVSAAITPSSITIKPGASGTLTITVTPAGGYTGTVSFSCGMLPTDVSCTFAPPSITLAAGSGRITDTLTINTGATESAMLSSPMDRGRPSQAYPAMMFWLPGSLAALTGIFPRKRKRPFERRLWMLALMLLALGGTGVLSGCGGMSNDARPGTYAIPITLTLTGGAAQTMNATVIVQ